MITQRAFHFAKVLTSLQISEEVIHGTEQCLLICLELTEALENPLVKKMEKYKVIETVFDAAIVDFMKLLCAHEAIGIFEEIQEAYEALTFEQRGILKAKLCYTMEPEDAQLEQIKNMLCEKYQKKDVFLQLEEAPSLIGGFVLYVGGTEFDKSIKGAISELQKALIER